MHSILFSYRLLESLISTRDSTVSRILTQARHSQDAPREESASQQFPVGVRGLKMRRSSEITCWIRNLKIQISCFETG